MKPRKRIPRLVRIEGDAGDIMAGGKKGAKICSNALLIAPGADWSVCTVFDAGGIRYVTTEVKTSALKRVNRAGITPLGKTASYKKALAAATDMASVGIGTVEMAVAWEVHEATAEMLEKAQSDTVRECLEEDIGTIYKDVLDLSEKYSSDPPKKIARAVVECYCDNDMDMKSTHDEVYGEMFVSTYLL